MEVILKNTLKSCFENIYVLNLYIIQCSLRLNSFSTGEKKTFQTVWLLIGTISKYGIWENLVS
jgi:hypothetical protein